MKRAERVAAVGEGRRCLVTEDIRRAPQQEDSLYLGAVALVKNFGGIKMAKVLVVFYSRKGENHMPGGIQMLEKGHTAYAAEYIQKALDADIFEIDTAEAYAANYRECCMQAAAEAKANARPKIKGFVADMTVYDTIFVCFPCWCGTAPMCVFTFLEQYDLAGKRLIPLCTNEGSGLAKAPQDLEKSCPGAIVVPGLSVRGHQVKDSEAMITAWAKEQV